MAESEKAPIVIKRKKKGGHEGGHGGAWKIAYADFVTAMMAFFLLMWLLSSAPQEKLSGIASYFKTPLKIALAGGASVGDTTSPVKLSGSDTMTRQTGAEGKTATKPFAPDAQGGFKPTGPEETKKKSKESKQAPQDQQKAGEKPSATSSPQESIDLVMAEVELEKREKVVLEDLKKKVEVSIANTASLKQFSQQILLDNTPEGLRVQVIDMQNRPMFASGSAQFQPYAGTILRELGKVLNEVPNKVSLSGHTDAKPFVGGERGYSNWELSSDRANASRRELIAGGMDDSKIIRVVGLGSAVPFDADDPLNPINRRISIIVMKRKAEENIRSESGSMDTMLHGPSPNGK